jgi:hypothetical protein
MLSLLARMPELLAQRTIAYLPDEYLYASLGRSLAEHGRPLVRGSHYALSALAWPLLQAPLWRLADLFGNPQLGYRLVQGEAALCFSLAAVPVYLIGRTIGLRRGYALAAATLALCIPEGSYSSLLLSESLALPLVLTAIWTAIRALDRPSHRNQAWFLAAAAAACFCRLQFAVLPLLYLLVLALRARPRRQERLLRAHRSLLGLAVLVMLGLAAFGGSRLLGIYNGFGSSLRAAASQPLQLLDFGGVDLALGMLAAGLVTVPVAVLAAWSAFQRLDAERERILVLLTSLLMLSGALVAAVFASAGYGSYETRYSFYFAPLVLVLACSWLQRGALNRLLAALGIVGMVGGLALLQPVHLAIDNAAAGSAELFALHLLDQHLYGYAVGMADRQVLAALTIVGAVAVLALRYRQPGLILVLAAAVMLPLQLGAAHFSAATVPQPWLLSRADGAPLVRSTTGHTLLLPGASRLATFESGFLYPGLDHPSLLTGAPANGLAAPRTTIASDGLLTGSDGAALPAGKLLLLNEGAIARFAGKVTTIAFSSAATLVVTAQPPRLQLLLVGGGHGTLFHQGTISLWSAGQVNGRLSFRLRAPGNQSASVVFTPSYGPARTVLLSPRHWQMLTFRVCGRSGSSALSWTSNDGVIRSLGASVQSALIDRLAFRADSSGC